MNKALPRAAWLVSPLLSALGVGCASAVLSGTWAGGYRFLWTAALAALCVLGRRFFTVLDGRMRRCFGTLGLFFVGAQALGFRLEIADRTGLDGLLLCAGAAVGMAPAAGYAFAALYRWLQTLKPAGNGGWWNEKKVRWFSFAVIFISWLPVLLAYWPGISSYDIYTQLDEIFSGRLTNRNPLLHTLVMGGFYLAGRALGSEAIGYALFMLLQMAVMAFSFAAVIRYVWLLKAPGAVTWASLALFALLPVHSMLSVSDTKDGFFAAFLALCMIRLHRLYRDPALWKNKRFLAGLIALAVLMCMMRNNAFVGLLLGLAAGLGAAGRENRKRLCALMLGSLALYFGVMNGLKAVCGASGSLSTELVSVQSQQMGRVYSLYHDAEPEDCYEIMTWLPTVQDYTPYTADPLKTFAIVDKPERMWGFLKLWGRVGLSHPVEYLDAWLLNTKGYWFLDDTTHARVYGEGTDKHLGYLLSNQAGTLGLKGQSRLPGLKALYERLFSANEYQRIPVVSLLFAPSFWLWVCAFIITAARYSASRRAFALAAMVSGCFLPLLFGACALIRYAYPFVVCMPLALGCALAEKKGGVNPT